MLGTGISFPGGYCFLMACLERLNGEAVINRFANSAGVAIIHVAGINLFWCPSEYSIRQSVKNALALAQRREFSSIAFPLIGAGVGSYPPERVMEFMKEEVANSGYSGEVRIVRLTTRP